MGFFFFFLQKEKRVFEVLSAELMIIKKWLGKTECFSHGKDILPNAKDAIKMRPKMRSYQAEIYQSWYTECEEKKKTEENRFFLFRDQTLVDNL